MKLKQFNWPVLCSLVTTRWVTNVKLTSTWWPFPVLCYLSLYNTNIQYRSEFVQQQSWYVLSAIIWIKKHWKAQDSAIRHFTHHFRNTTSENHKHLPPYIYCTFPHNCIPTYPPPHMIQYTYIPHIYIIATICVAHVCSICCPLIMLCSVAYKVSSGSFWTTVTCGNLYFTL